MTKPGHREWPAQAEGKIQPGAGKLNPEAKGLAPLSSDGTHKQGGAGRETLWGSPRVKGSRKSQGMRGWAWRAVPRAGVGVPGKQEWGGASRERPDLRAVVEESKGWSLRGEWPGERGPDSGTVNNVVLLTLGWVSWRGWPRRGGWRKLSH